jgi:hypothetical protein
MLLELAEERELVPPPEVPDACELPPPPPPLELAAEECEPPPPPAEDEEPPDDPELEEDPPLVCCAKSERGTIRIRVNSGIDRRMEASPGENRST